MTNKSVTHSLRSAKRKKATTIKDISGRNKRERELQNQPIDS
ncbi:hypothetical protein [Bacillus horti]|uniref:Uncharacterized protein n=1 Tax=Caldalkalibacillus horti TaxID=77523 RepID=A0ABT9W181_9BACI|nr:hypothetical protein [Bacillus horti]